MTTLLPLLAMLVCPIGMGLMMWLMMRGQHDEPSRHGEGMYRSAPEPLRPIGRHFTVAGLCLDWNVVIGLVAVGGVVWVVAPHLVWRALPLLLLLACPLSMLVMMGGMRKSHSASQAGHEPQHTAAADDAREAQFAVLRAPQAVMSREIVDVEAISDSLRCDPAPRVIASVDGTTERA